MEEKVQNNFIDKKIGKKQFKMAEIRGVQFIDFRDF
jgi:hypothetical protein